MLVFFMDQIYVQKIILGSRYLALSQNTEYHETKTTFSLIFNFLSHTILKWASISFMMKGKDIIYLYVKWWKLNLIIGSLFK